MKEQKREQISIEFFREIWCNAMNEDWDKSLKLAKKMGYIKQSHEEEIRKELKKRFSKRYMADEMLGYIQLQEELIDILDNKNK